MENKENNSTQNEVDEEEVKENGDNRIAIFFHDLVHLDLLSWTKVMISNGLNLFFILIIFGLSLWMGQGNVFPIDLYNSESLLNSSINIVMFHMLLMFLGLIMSFYPTYIYTILFTKNNYEWFIDFKGLIQYKGDSKSTHLKKIESAFRKYLAGFLFIIWSIVLVKIYYSYPKGSMINDCFEKSDPLYNIPIIMLGIYIISYTGYSWYKNLYEKKAKEDSDEIICEQAINKNENHSKEDNDEEKLVYCPKRKRAYYIAAFIIVVPILLLLVLNAFYGWSPIILLTEMFICMILSFYLIYFRNNRKLFFGRSIYNYLGFHRYIGYIVFLFIIGINMSMLFAESINPLNIILGTIIIFYTIIIYTIKVYLFLKKGNGVGQSNNKLKIGIKNKFIWLDIHHYTALILVLICFFSFNIINGNSLHELRKVTITSKKISLPNFYQTFVNSFNNGCTPIFYAAYGGGLKANYWNSLILDTLYNMNNFNDIVAFSGVSGGGMGIGNYSAGLYQGLNKDTMRTLVSNVKGSNILGIELPLLFFKDLIKEMLPDAFINGKDRSNRAMRFYAGLMKDKEGLLVDSISFYNVYDSLFTKFGYYPNIIINSTSTVNKYGVVSAVGHETAFPGAINLLDFHHTDKSLTYFEAVSTCNRFPFVSPAANIPEKGHFLDGGYYENSGIMSIASFKNALEVFEQSDSNIVNQIFSEKVKLVSVRNDKMNYLESLLLRDSYTKDILDNYEMVSTKDFSETKAVLSGIVSLERHPNYLRDNFNTYHKDEYEMIFIDLPYYITDDDILSYFGGEPVDLHYIKHLVHDSNDIIAKMLDTSKYDMSSWGIIDPPTARLLSKPVEEYMEVMMEHPSVIEAIKEIYDD